MTLRKITEQRVAIKFCVAGGTFSDSSIKTEKQKLFFKTLQNFTVSFFMKNGRFPCGLILIFDEFRGRKRIRSEFLI